MSDNSKLVAAPMPVTLGGQEWQMSPLTDLDHEELSQWVRAEHLRLAAQAASGMDKRTFDRVIGVALKQAHRMEWMDEDGREVASTLRGMTQLILQSIKKKHPSATFEEVQKALLSGDKDENLTLAMRTFREVNAVKSKNEETPPEG